jgi:hypothetical protein
MNDLWLPNHLHEMEVLLSEYEFGHLAFVYVAIDYGPMINLADLGDPEIRDRMTSDGEVFNQFGPTQAGYRMDNLPPSSGWLVARRHPAFRPTSRCGESSCRFPTPLQGRAFVLTSVTCQNSVRKGLVPGNGGVKNFPSMPR